MKLKTWHDYKNKVLIPLYEHELNITYCENCGGFFGLSFHHLKRRSKKGENTLANIMLLCAKCHHEADNGKDHIIFNARLKEKANKRYWVIGVDI